MPRGFSKRSKMTTKSFGTANVKNLVKDLSLNIPIEVNRRYLKSVAEIAADEVKARIKLQSYDHIPLNPDYVKEKREKGWDSRILIRTGTYLKNIGVQEVEFPRGVGYRVGLPDGVTESDSELPLTRLARMLEFGTTKMPARPHFGPVLRDIKSRIRELRAQMVKELDKELEKRMSGLRTAGRG